MPLFVLFIYFFYLRIAVAAARAHQIALLLSHPAQMTLKLNLSLAALPLLMAQSPQAMQLTSIQVRLPSSTQKMSFMGFYQNSQIYRRALSFHQMAKPAIARLPILIIILEVR